MENHFKNEVQKLCDMQITPVFTAEIIFKFGVFKGCATVIPEGWWVVKNYMEQKGWRYVSGGKVSHYPCDSYDASLIYAKKFIDTSVMQKEIQDINDAFNL